MKLFSIEFLNLRHRYWVQTIESAGIWDSRGFKPVEIQIGRRASRLHGKFMRKRVRAGLRVQTRDYIILYPQSHELTVREIDDTLVHEMIHQYIAQNSLRDSGPHGPVFKGFMARINQAFPNELSISVRASKTEEFGSGDTVHYLLLLNMSAGDWIVCRVSKSSLVQLGRLVRRDGEVLGICGYKVGYSFDRYFNSFTACRTRLRGQRMSATALDSLCEKCNIKIVNTE